MPQKPIGIATTVLALTLIGALTLFPTGSELPSHFDLCVPCGDLGTADFTLNVLLFIPLGFGLRLAGVRRRWALLGAFLLTVTIEALQFWVVTGRNSDLSDIVANSAGAALGVVLADIRGRLLFPSATRARRLAAGWGVLLCAWAAAVQWALAADLPYSIYYEQVAPDLGQFAVFPGVVYNATFDDAPFRVGRLSADSSQAMRDALMGSGARITASFQTSPFVPAPIPPPGSEGPASPVSLPAPPLPQSPSASSLRSYTPHSSRLAPIVSVFDQHRREIFVLGRRVDDLVFRLRRRSYHLGFHPPSTILPGAFVDFSSPTDTLRATATVDRGSVGLELAGPRGAIRGEIGLGVWDTWRLFVPDSGRFGFHQQTWLIVTMACFWLPFGYWAGRGGRRSTLLLLGAALVSLVITLAIIPWAAGSLPAPWPVWCMGAASIAVAWAISLLVAKTEDA